MNDFRERVLSELGHLRTDVAKVENKLDNLVDDVSTLRAKAAVWGAVGAGLVALIFEVYHVLH